jgi:hypothetical protein
MRNEIYNRIRQNKMKYYAELNTIKPKTSPVVNVVEKEPEEIIPAREKQPREQNLLLKKVQEFDFKSMFKKVPEVVKSGYKGTVKSKAMNALKTQVINDHDKIKQFSSRVNRKIDRQTDKLANGVYNMSSFLFEEQKEKNNQADYSNGNLIIETVDANSFEWQVAEEIQTTSSVYDKIGELSERTFDYLRAAPANFKKYLASDETKDWYSTRLSLRR